MATAFVLRSGDNGFILCGARLVDAG